LPKPVEAGGAQRLPFAARVATSRPSASLHAPRKFRAVITFLLVVHGLIALALVAVILLQRSEGGGLGIGGGTGGGLMSARGAANLLTRSTTVLASLFIVSSIVLAILAAGTNKPKAIDTSLVAPVIGAPEVVPGSGAPEVAPGSGAPEVAPGSGAPLVVPGGPAPIVPGGVPLGLPSAPAPAPADGGVPIQQ
jgi:preprotein translocase subunit SecG